MREKFLNGIFGKWPCVTCDKQVLIPIGLSEDLKYCKVKGYCPKPARIKGRSVSLDGAYFGTFFEYIFF